jgi:hypothetical protein
VTRRNQTNTTVLRPIHGEVLAAGEIHHGRTESGHRANGRPALPRAGDETAEHSTPKSPSGYTTENT